jgi:hypothetical protein
MAGIGSDVPSFFQRVNSQPLSSGGALINTQIDPTLPSARGVVRVSDPVLADQNFRKIISAFDPDIYDLRPTSHLVRLIKALTGAAGTGGLKKQIITSRMASTLAVTAFTDLDAFYGALFNFNRYAIESMPLNTDGTQLDPYTDVATIEQWDDVLSRDARYRSRIFQVARAINMGASISGIRGVCESLLSTEVDIVESWKTVDMSYRNTSLSAPAGLTYGNIKAQYVTNIGFYKSYNFAEGGQFGAGIAPVGNRSEVVITPRRLITNEEKVQLLKVLATIRPSHVQITLGTQLNQNVSQVPARSYFSDSEDWDVVTRVTPSTDLNQPTDSLYSGAGSYSVARPVFSEYSGEAWTNNPNIVKAYSYQIVDGATTTNTSTETVVFQDQTNHTYAPTDSVMDTRQALAERLSGDGVVTVYPYVGTRQ